MERQIRFDVMPDVDNVDNDHDDSNRKTALQGNRLMQKFYELYSRSSDEVISSVPSSQQYSISQSHSKSLNKKKQGQRSLLICYATAGYPDAQITKEIISHMIHAGADIIEIGIPFSDPIADGPIIQEASFIALSNGMTPEKSLQIVKDIRKRFSEIPIVLMTYSNILVKAGLSEFLGKARESGADGFILPDMPIEEASDFVKEATRLNLATVFLASPNTEEERLRNIASKSTGFLYLISTYGTTGIRDSFDRSTAGYIRNARRIVGPSLPIAVGFGISKPQHAKFMINAGADAIIVASAIINIIRLYEMHQKNKKKDSKSIKEKRMKDLLAHIDDFVSSMKEACMRQ